MFIIYRHIFTKILAYVEKILYLCNRNNIQLKRLGRLDNVHTLHMIREFTIIVVYSDDTEFSFIVKVEGPDHKIMAELSMITRGILMTSSAQRAYCYNDQGFVVCSYIR